MKSRIAIYTTTNINATKLSIAADIASNEKYNATEDAIGEIMNLLPPTTGTTFLASIGSSDIELIDYMGDEFDVTCLTSVETDADDYRLANASVKTPAGFSDAFEIDAFGTVEGVYTQVMFTGFRRYEAAERLLDIIGPLNAIVVDYYQGDALYGKAYKRAMND